MSDTVAPHGTDDTGAPVETVTVEASRLPNWPMLLGIGALLLIAFTGDNDDET